MSDAARFDGRGLSLGGVGRGASLRRPYDPPDVFREPYPQTCATCKKDIWAGTHYKLNAFGAPVHAYGCASADSPTPWQSDPTGEF